MDRHLKRRDRVRRELKKLKLDTFLVSNETNVTYLTGFTGDSSHLIISKDGDTIATDFRYITQLEDECPGLDMAVRGAGSPLTELLKEQLDKRGSKKIGIESETLTLSLYKKLCEILGEERLVSTQQVVERFRMIKDKQELATIRHAVTLAQKAFAVIRASIRPDQSERLLAAELEHQIRVFGGTGCSFPPIFGVGSRAALPHAGVSDRKVSEAGFILIDWGAEYCGYRSDLTRVLATSKISTQLRRVYGVVLNAQKRAIDKIKAGVSIQEVDAAARKTIAKAGYGKNFGHGLGHGIGLDIHESPRMGPALTDPLEAGMVVTVEPGIYIPGWGGVRIEDDVLVTRDGCEVLSDVPKELADCVVA